MLQDDRVRGLATEFAGNWLDFRRFEEHNSVDRERFPSFDDELRRSMFEEPIRFFVDVVRNDRSVLEFLDGKHTFVNRSLAKHYGMPEPSDDPDVWTRVDDATRYGRGGLLPMAVFLTQNSPGLRTSPVKRGYWVVRRLLGENIPAPPANVPDLPDDEAKLGDQTLRQALARHRNNEAARAATNGSMASAWPSRVTGPSARLVRSTSAAARSTPVPNFPAAAKAKAWRGSAPISRPAGARNSSKTSAASCSHTPLDGSLIPSDDATIEAMRAKLEADGDHFGSLVESDRHQPSVPEQASRRPFRRSPPDERCREPAETSRLRATRRMFLRGVGVTMALPWLESVPAWACAGVGE